MRRRPPVRTAVVGALLPVLLSGAAFAPPPSASQPPQPDAAEVSNAARKWQLDPSFSDDGVTTTSLSDKENQRDWANNVAVQPDGRIVAAGTHHYYGDGTDSGDIAVVRYRADGSLDPTFGDGGMLLLSIGRYDDVRGLALQEIGGETRIVLSGHVFKPEGVDRPRHQAFVLRLHPDGSLDTDGDDDPDIHLDHDGVATIAFRYGVEGGPVTIDPDNRIVAAGTADRKRWLTHVTAVYRLLPETGALDPSLGGDGTVILRPRGRLSAPYDIAVQPVGSGYRVLVVGLVSAPRGTNWVVSRLRPDGSFDQAFGGGDGVVTLSLRHPRVYQSFTAAWGVALDPTGSIYLVGEATIWVSRDSDASRGHPVPVPAMARLTPTGALDTRFSDNGKARLVRVRSGRPDLDAADVVLGADGSIAWTGNDYSPTGGQQQAMLVGGRLPAGAPDTRFGDKGYLRVSVGPSADVAQGIVRDRDGRLLVVGIAEPVGPSVHDAFAVARLRLG